MINRRCFVAAAALSPLAPLARNAVAGPAPTFRTSKLIYLTPLKSDGGESRCKAEIWFGYHGGDLFVVTPPTAWRAQAVAKGLTRARLWVGEYGVWTQADGAFREGPEYMARATLEAEADTQAAVLAGMAEKYADDGWARWGPRFEAGLANGERVMIRYRLDV